MSELDFEVSKTPTATPGGTPAAPTAVPSVDPQSPAQPPIPEGDVIGQITRDSINQTVLESLPLEQEVPKVDLGLIDSFGQGAGDMSIIGGGIRGGTRYFSDIGPDLEVDFDFLQNKANVIEADPVLKTTVNEMIAKQKDDSGASNLLERVLDARNEEELRYYIKQFEQYKRDQANTAAADMVPYVGGVLAGLGTDILVTALGSGGLGIVGAGSRVGTAATLLAARVKAGRKLAAWGSLEGGADVAVQGLSDPGITTRELMFGFGLGAIVGGSLGTAAPRMLDNVIIKSDLDKVAKEIEDELEFRATQGGARDGGAAAVDNANEFATLPAVTPIFGTGSEFGTKYLPDWIRTPKRTLTDWYTVGAKDRKLGLVGTSALSAALARVYRISTLSAEDLEGLPRVPTLESGIEALNATITAAEQEVTGVYRTLMNEAFNQGAFGQYVNNSGRALGTGRMMGDNAPPTQQEVNNWADQLAQARGDMELALEASGSDVGPPRQVTGNVALAEERIWGNIKERVGADAFEKVKAAVTQISAIDDDFYQQLGKAEVAAGLLKAEDLKAGYRPQIWDRDHIQSNPEQFKAMLASHISRTPDADWVNDSFSVPKVEAEGETPRTKLIEEGETFEDLVQRDPTLASAIMEDWEIGRIQVLQGKLDEAEARIEWELQRFESTTAAQVLDEHPRRLARFNDRIARLNEQLHEAKGDPELSLRIDTLSKQIAKIELKRAEYRTTVEDILKANGDVEELRAVLDKHSALIRRITGGPSPKRAQSQAKIDIDKQRNKSARISARQSITDIVDDVYRKLVDGKSLTGVAINDKAITNSKHFKRRAIDLAGVRDDPRWQAFLKRDSGLNRELYGQAAGRQVEMQNKFAPFLETQGVTRAADGPLDIPAEMRKYIDNSFSADMETIAQKVRDGSMTPEEATAATQRLAKDRVNGLKFFDKVFAEFTRADYVKSMDDLQDRVVSTAQSAVSSMVLGKILLAVVIDLAVVAMAGGRFGVGFKGLMTQSSVRTAIKDLAGDDKVLELFLRGEAAVGNSAAAARFDLDAPSLQNPDGGIASRIQNAAHTVATAQGWANMMHPWNRWIRGTAGIGMAEEILKQAGNVNKLTPSLRGFYAKHGLGTDDLKAIAILAKRHPKKSGSFNLTDLTKWADDTVEINGKTVGGGSLVAKYKRALNSAANEALIDPSIGDRPFGRATPFGRLILTLSSFMFTAGERYVAPLIQQGIIDPKAGRVFMSVIMAMGLAVTTNSLREAMAGKEPTIMRDDDEAFWNAFKAAWLRSPFAVGMSGTISDVASNAFGGEINDSFKATTGSDFDIINTEFAKFSNQQGMAALGGPVPGVLNSFFQIFSGAADRDPDKTLEMLMHRTPILNTLPAVMLSVYNNHIKE